MQILQIILSIFSIITIGCLFFRPKIGVAAYMAYMFFAPHLIIGNVILGTRTESLIVMLAFFLTYFRKTPKAVYLPLKPFLIFYGLQLLLVPFSFDMDYSFGIWMIEFSRIIFFVFLASAIYQSEKEGIGSLYTNVLFAITLLVIIYGLFLTAMPGINPYQMMLQPIFGGEFNEVYASGNGGLSNSVDIADGRIFGRISSLFSDPQEYALVLGFMLLLSWNVVSGKVMTGIMTVAIIVAIITCGVRTPIAAIIITIAFLMLYSRKYKYFLYAFISASVLLYIIPLISPELNDYVSSVINPSADTSIKGSSLEMRLSQLDGCVGIIENSPIFGKGIGWTGWYLAKFEGHPQALYFESILFSVLCNMGVVGIVLWSVLGNMYCHTVQRNIVEKKNKAVLYALLIYYLAYTGITGDYGYLPQFVLMFTVLYFHCKKNEETIKE